jgi:hypothetical protein
MWYNCGMIKYPKEAKKKTSMTLSPEALRLLAEMSETMGISMSAILELAIRDKAQVVLVQGTDGATATRHPRRTPTRSN